MEGRATGFTLDMTKVCPFVDAGTALGLSRPQCSPGSIGSASLAERAWRFRDLLRLTTASPERPL